MDIQNICDPAKTFAILGAIDIIFILLFRESFQDKPFINKVKILILATILVLGWATIVNFSCDSTDNYIAWGLVLIPTILLSLRWNK
jgi:hypothetical protein